MGTHWLCPKQNQSITLTGAYATRQSRTLKIEVYDCGTYYPSKQNCATE